MSLPRWYWCARCEVLGKGDACWACGRTILVREGPLVDRLVFDDVSS